MTKTKTKTVGRKKVTEEEKKISSRKKEMTRTKEEIITTATNTTTNKQLSHFAHGKRLIKVASLISIGKTCQLQKVKSKYLTFWDFIAKIITPNRGSEWQSTIPNTI